MEIKSLNKPKNELSSRTTRLYSKFNKLLNALESKNIPKPLIEKINGHVDDINQNAVDEKVYRKELRKSYECILKFVRKEKKLVPKNYYRNLWIAIGMSSFGVPIGVAFGLSLDNMAFLGVGLPIGMVIGMAVGASMDNKSQKEGKQLDIDI
jgi:hypothetical protein